MNQSRARIHISFHLEKTQIKERILALQTPSEGVLFYLWMSRETVRTWFFTQMAALCKKPPSLTSYSECLTNDWTPATHTFLSLSVSESFKAKETSITHWTYLTRLYDCGLCRDLPDRRLCVWSCAMSWKTVSKSSSAESSKRQSCTEEKNVEATSQMKEISGSMLPASDRLLVSDRVAWSFSKIFSMYTSPIRGSVQEKKQIK